MRRKSKTLDRLRPSSLHVLIPRVIVGLEVRWAAAAVVVCRKEPTVQTAKMVTTTGAPHNFG